MINPSSSQQASSNELYLAVNWRERFIRAVLIAFCILGIPAIIGYLRFTSATGGLKILAVMTYAILILVTWLPNIPYILKAGFFLFLLYFAGLTTIPSHGIGDASIIFFGFIIMAGLLLPIQSATFYATGVALLSLVTFGWEHTATTTLMTSVATFLIISVATVVALNESQRESTKAQEASRQMLDTLQSERSTLEHGFEERTAELEKRTEELRATAYIARKTAEVQDLASLLNMVARLVTDEFGFYHTGVFLINETGDQAVLQAASSEGGRRMIERGHSLAVGLQGIVGYVAAQKKSRIALDVGADAVFFNNPDLPRTRSEVALPLLVRGKVLGVLDIQSDKPQAFSADDIDVLQTLSDQVAIAIENARLLDETQAAIIQLEALTSLRTREAWGRKLGQRGHAFTYTPLGLRAEKTSQAEDKAISIPIMLRGQKIGDISIARKGDATWSKLDKDLVEEVASQVGLAVDNIRLLEEATRRAKQEETVGKLATRFSQSLDLDTLLQTAARELGQLPDVSEVSVVIGQETEQTSQPKQRSKRNVS